MKHHFLTAIAALALCGETAAQSFMLNPANGHHYAAVLAPGIAWGDAKTAAESVSYLGYTGHLATVTSATEQSFLVSSFLSTFSGKAPDPSYGQAWLGGFQNPTDETVSTANWNWINGEGSFPGVNGASGHDNAFSAWNTNTFSIPGYFGEPNDTHGPGTEQMLVIFRFADGSWNDSGNDTWRLAGYIIEVDTPAVPEPSAYATASGVLCVGVAIWLRKRRQSA